MPPDQPFAFLQTNERENKPRSRGLTEIRGPYYTPMGKRYLQDVLETMGTYVDSFKFAGGPFRSCLVPSSASLYVCGVRPGLNSRAQIATDARALAGRGSTPFR